MKMLPYGRQSISRDDIREVVKTLASDWITQGPKIKEFEEALCKYTGAKYVVAVSSGTAALHIACLALETGEKGNNEIVVSPITFLASANAIIYSGGSPVFADVCGDTINIDPCEIEKKAGKKTRAIIPVHFAGNPCDMKRISGIAEKYNLSVIEDACHALGAEYEGTRIGSCKYSDMTVFSFHPVKHITTGEGGAVTTNRKDLYDKLLALRNHGIIRDKSKLKNWDGPWYYEMHFLGFNYRITDFQCALGISQLRKLDKFLERRREIAGIYNRKLSLIDEIILPKVGPGSNPAWHIYPVRLKNHLKRNKIYDQLRKAGIATQVHYIPVHLQPYYRKRFGYKKGDFPLAEEYYRGALTIPLYPGMEQKDITYVAETLKRLLK